MFKFLNLHQKGDNAIVRFAANAAFLIPFCIMCLKLFGYIITDSISLKASFIDSVSDIIASLVIIASIKISQKPANSAFQFGYGKVEALGSLIQSLFIFISGIYLFMEAIQSFIHKEEVKYSGIAIAIVITTCLLLFLLTRIQKYVISRTDSLIIKASFLHFHLDILFDIGVLITLLLNDLFHLRYLDSIFGVCFTMYLFRNSFTIIKKSFEVLLDKSMSEKSKDQIKNILLRYQEIRYVEYVKTRISGMQKLITLKFYMDPNETLENVEKIKEAVIKDIFAVHKNCVIVIDVDPFVQSKINEIKKPQEQSNDNLESFLKHRIEASEKHSH